MIKTKQNKTKQKTTVRDFDFLWRMAKITYMCFHTGKWKPYFSVKRNAIRVLKTWLITSCVLDMPIDVVSIHTFSVEKKAIPSRTWKNVSVISAISARHLFFKADTDKWDITQRRKLQKWLKDWKTCLAVRYSKCQYI